jgi:hypothetical protein
MCTATDLSLEGMMIYWKGDIQDEGIGVLERLSGNS